jgi:hypothetical protein
MKLILIALIASALALTDLEEWEAFKIKYNKNYNMPGANVDYRFSVFQSNLRRAEEIQRGDQGATYGVTQFMDLTPEEFHASYANLNITMMGKWVKSLPSFTLPARQMGTDWKAKGLVSSVKDQGQCGSCWAFSAAAAAEGCFAVKKGQSTSLSAQQIVDCCTAGGSSGCNGGYPDECLQWAMARNIATWASYPYKTSKGTCQTSFTTGLPANTCKFYSSAATELALKASLTHNVVSICLDANPLQYYSGGVISGTTCNNRQVDHAVLLVSDEAPGNTVSPKAYLVKNSWGSSWGESGYFRVAQGVNCLALTTENSLAY